MSPGAVAIQDQTHDPQHPTPWLYQLSQLDGWLGVKEIYEYDMKKQIQRIYIPCQKRQTVGHNNNLINTLNFLQGTSLHPQSYLSSVPLPISFNVKIPSLGMPSTMTILILQFGLFLQSWSFTKRAIQLLFVASMLKK